MTLLGCASAQNTSSQALDTVGTETSASYNKVRDIFDVGPKPTPPVSKPQPRYCYKTYQDIVCYAKPLPGEEYRLVGYQSSTGKTGYTLPQTYPPQDISEIGATTSPQKSDSPPPAASDSTESKGDKQLKEIIFDPSELDPKELVPDKPQ